MSIRPVAKIVVLCLCIAVVGFIVLEQREKRSGDTRPEVAADLGVDCSQKSDCEYDCLFMSDKRDTEGFLLGSCGIDSVVLCAPRIDKKTKDKNELIPWHGGCI